VEGSGHGLILRYYPSTFLEGLKKTKKNVSEDNWSLGQENHLGSPKYEAKVITT
jgi:hypothetical protein